MADSPFHRLEIGQGDFAWLSRCQEPAIAVADAG